MVWIAFSTTYESIFAAAMVCGVGSSMYHPEAALMVNHIAGKKQGKAMGTFSVGGNLGFAVGPAAAGVCAYILGIHWMVLFGLVNLILSSLILWKMKEALELASLHQKEAAQKAVQRQNHWGPFGKLSICITGRSIAFELCNTFIPVYWIHELGADGTSGANALTLLFTIGALLTYSGGIISDKVGMRKIIRGAFIVMIPSMYFLFETHDEWLAWILLLPVAMSIFTSYSPMVVLGQTYLAKNVGFASGVTLGLSTTIGGLFAPLVGWAADQWGLSQALQILWITGVIGTVVSFTLPCISKETGQ